jgi:hypothetical protein
MEEGARKLRHVSRNKQQACQILTRSRTNTPHASHSAGSAMTMTIPAATAILPAHREWPDLFDLELPAITDHLQRLKQRCTHTRVALDTSLTHFDALTQSLIGEQSINSSQDVANYLLNFKIVLETSRGVFPPQEAYRAAITTLGLFVTDLIDVLPRKSELWKRMRPEFDNGMLRANLAEDNIRTSLRGLVTTRKGEERYGLALYLHLMHERVKSWDEEEGRFIEWAKECVVAML